MKQIGTLKTLRRYPVKSMAGEDLAEVYVTYAGLVGDRVFAFVDDNNRSSFPWMTGRQGHEMILFRPRFLAPPAAAEERPAAEQFKVEVEVPEGKKFRAGEDEFTRYFGTRFGRSVSVRFSERAMTDACPVSIFGLDTVRALSEETSLQLDHRRFRANFYVAWANGQPYFENSLVGKTVQIGEKLTVQVIEKDPRCVMITLDPETARPSPNVLEAVSKKHEGCIGVYGAVLREGIVRVNDPVYAVQ